ncbi:unnamed protein product [Sphagnum troendelagicum]|uniref:Uncharacterized protein n=1 Tax=Sphagnum troendelagicum TaxID=128251 RepID=A0ABP0UL02_9BRYO
MGSVCLSVVSGVSLGAIARFVEASGIQVVHLETGKAVGKTARAAMKNGNCQWQDPVVESMQLQLDQTTNDDEQNFYKLLLLSSSVINVPAALFIRLLQEHCSERVDCDIDASAAAAFYSTTGNGTAGYSQLSFPLVNSSEQEEVLPPAHCTALGSHFLIWNAPYLSVWELLYLNGDGKTVTQVK